VHLADLLDLLRSVHSFRDSIFSTCHPIFPQTWTLFRLKHSFLPSYSLLITIETRHGSRTWFSSTGKKSSSSSRISLSTSTSLPLLLAKRSYRRPPRSTVHIAPPRITDVSNQDPDEWLERLHLYLLSEFDSTKTPWWDRPSFNLHGSEVGVRRLSEQTESLFDIVANAANLIEDLGWDEICRRYAPSVCSAGTAD
jgi:hypothetical protein